MSTCHGEVDIEKDDYVVVEIKETTEMLGEVEMFEVEERGGRSRVEFWSRGGCSQACGEVREDPDNSELFSPDGIGDPAELCNKLIIFFSWLFMLVTFPFSLLLAVKWVQEYERAVVYRLGRSLDGALRGPGIFFILPCTDTFERIDMRTQNFLVPPQDVYVNAVMYYRVADAESAVNNVDDYAESARLIASTTLRNVLGTKRLGEILSDTDSIAQEIKSELDLATSPWGVLVERVEVKDVSVPEQLQRSLASEAEAVRESRAKVIAAEGELQASKSLAHAAQTILDSPQSIQLRFLQTLNNISEDSEVILFPLPIEVIKWLTQGQKKK